MVEKTGRDSDKFMLRLPDGMRQKIKSAAQESGRSMNAEIVFRLEEAFNPAFCNEDSELENLDTSEKMERVIAIMTARFSRDLRSSILTLIADTDEDQGKK